MQTSSILLIFSMVVIVHIWIKANNDLAEQDGYIDFQNPDVFKFNLQMMFFFMLDVAAFLYF